MGKARFTKEELQTHHDRKDVEVDCPFTEFSILVTRITALDRMMITQTCAKDDGTMNSFLFQLHACEAAIQEPKMDWEEWGKVDTKTVDWAFNEVSLHNGWSAQAKAEQEDIFRPPTGNPIPI